MLYLLRLMNDVRASLVNQHKKGASACKIVRWANCKTDIDLYVMFWKHRAVTAAKQALAWLTGGKKNSERSHGGEFPSFCETQAKARAKLGASYYVNLLRIHLTYKLDHACKIYFVVVQPIFGRMGLFHEVTSLNYTLDFPLAGLTRDIDYPDGRFRSHFNHIRGQYLKLQFCRGYFVPIHQLRIVLPFDAIKGVSKILKQTSEVRSPHQNRKKNRINILSQNSFRGRVHTFTLLQSFRFSSLGTLITPSIFNSN
jgi:hypothetical protein